MKITSFCLLVFDYLARFSDGVFKKGVGKEHAITWSCNIA